MKPKFKKGDKIRCVEETSAVGVEVGGIYTVKNPYYRSGKLEICIEVEEVETAIPYQSRFELVEEVEKPMFKVGDMVETPLGLFEVIDSHESNFLCYKEGFVGHSGSGYFGDKYVHSKYKEQLWWFDENELEILKVKEQSKPKYREMSPDTLVKVSIDGNKFEVPLKELLIASDLTGNVIGGHRASEFYCRTQEILGSHYFDSLGVVDYGNLELDDGYLHYFKPYFSKQKEKEALKKDIEEQKAVIKSQEEFIKELEDKYNSL